MKVWCTPHFPTIRDAPDWTLVSGWLRCNLIGGDFRIDFLEAAGNLCTPSVKTTIRPIILGSHSSFYSPSDKLWQFSVPFVFFQEGKTEFLKSESSNSPANFFFPEKYFLVVFLSPNPALKCCSLTCSLKTDSYFCCIRSVNHALHSRSSAMNNRKTSLMWTSFPTQSTVH